MNLQYIKRLPELILLLALFAIGGVFFAFTNPASVPSVVLVVGFMIIFAVVYMMLRLLLRLAGVQKHLSSVQYKVITLGGAGLPTLLLALQSIGQLTVRDIITILALFLAACFYAVRLASTR